MEIKQELLHKTQMNNNNYLKKKKKKKRTEQQTLLSQAFKLDFKSECFLCVYSLSSLHTTRIMSLSVKITMGKQIKYKQGGTHYRLYYAAFQ